MTDACYRKLREYLDQFPLGFPETQSGVEIKILERLFTPADAALFVQLTPVPETAAQISQRTGRDPGALASQLEAMSRAGLLFRFERELIAKYNTVPFMIGLYEYSVKKLDAPMADLFQQYYEEAYQKEMGVSDIPGFKVIPVQQHIDADTTLLPYHRIEEDIRGARVIAVTDCVCRKEARLLGHGCDHPLETCLSFGAAAEYYINSGLGRRVDADEAVDILRKADESGLVHAGANAAHLSNICNCCPCCCASMKGMVEKGHSKQKYMNALFEPQLDEEACTACEACMARCPVDAVRVADHADFDLDKCLGCGLCASGCPTDAVTMVLRQDRQDPYPRAYDLFMAILAAKKKTT
jgi:H+/Na+-translocating ferredoxin:NAD+ oxidoreductase subunit B